MRLTSFTLDDFLDDPDEAVRFAARQEFYVPPYTNIYGERSKDFREIAPALFDEINGKLRKVTDQFVEWPYEILYAKFQRFIPYVDPRLNVGWVHADYHADIAGIVYLNKDPMPGTSLMRSKPGQSPDPAVAGRLRNSHLGGRNQVSIQEFEAAHRFQTDRYSVDTAFGNAYNRLVAFDAQLPHRADDVTGAEPRLTIIIHVQSPARAKKYQEFLNDPHGNW